MTIFLFLLYVSAGLFGPLLPGGMYYPAAALLYAALLAVLCLRGRRAPAPFPKRQPGQLLWYLPLLLPATVNLWFGAALPTAGTGAPGRFFCLGLAGALEELFFRGRLLPWLSRKASPGRAVALDALLFALFHLLNALNLPTGQLLCQLLYTAALGALFALLYERGGRLWPVALTHALLNALDVFRRPAPFENHLPLQCALLAAFALLYGVFVLRRTAAERPSRP